MVLLMACLGILVSNGARVENYLLCWSNLLYIFQWLVVGVHHTLILTIRYHTFRCDLALFDEFFRWWDVVDWWDVVGWLDLFNKICFAEFCFGMHMLCAQPIKIEQNPCLCFDCWISNLGFYFVDSPKLRFYLQQHFATICSKIGSSSAAIQISKKISMSPLLPHVTLMGPADYDLPEVFSEVHRKVHWKPGALCDFQLNWNGECAWPSAVHLTNSSVLNGRRRLIDCSIEKVWCTTSWWGAERISSKKWAPLSAPMAQCLTGPTKAARWNGI